MKISDIIKLIGSGYLGKINSFLKDVESYVKDIHLTDEQLARINLLVDKGIKSFIHNFSKEGTSEKCQCD